MIEFQDRLWENVDAEWIECLRRESVQNLLLIPSGAVQVAFESFFFLLLIFFNSIFCLFIFIYLQSIFTV